MNSPNKNNLLPLFRKSGEMGALMEKFDWDNHPLGPPQHWPISLKNILNIILQSDFPMFVWWGPQLYMFHNDAYLPALGKKHPKALGAPAKVIWAEIWDQLGAIPERIFNGEPSFYAEELLLYLERKGFPEETYWTFSYSPAPGDDTEVGGMFCACFEVTKTVLTERRLKTIKGITEATLQAQTLEEACANVYDVLSQNKNDIPYHRIYLAKNDLEGCIHYVPFNEAIGNDAFDNFFTSEIKKLPTNASAQIINVPGELREDTSFESNEKATILPIESKNKAEIIGFLVSGLSNRLEFDADYANFFRSLVQQISVCFESVEARAEAKVQQNRLTNFLMQAPAVVCIVSGPELVFELVNPYYQQLFPNRDLLGKALLQGLPEIADQPVYKIITDVYRKGEPFIGKEVLLKSFNEDRTALEDIYFDFIYQPVFDKHGNVESIFVFAYQVTDLIKSRKALESLNMELTTANSELSRINSDLDNFIYTASHDLKAPISNIEGLINTLKRNLPSDFQNNVLIHQLISYMQNSVDRFKKVIADLTKISKTERQKQEYEEVDFREAINEVLLDLHDLIKANDAQIDVELNGISSITYSHKNLRSIVLNLISNGIKYRSPLRNPMIHLSLQEEGEYIALSITDNGLGVQPEKQSKIFGMFQRLHTHTEGTGLGLFIVKKIVEGSGGKIEVTSKVGEGSTFKVFLKKTMSNLPRR